MSYNERPLHKPKGGALGFFCAFYMFFYYKKFQIMGIMILMSGFEVFTFIFFEKLIISTFFDKFRQKNTPRVSVCYISGLGGLTMEFI